ncbi:hypothetical protein N7510_007120 [Penicillium lagena]|uniref:uncharacterized protein n=1 Tax=Penicillium lagena TaxID=94218 RepID=UPI0025417FBF|nr:uncharacterized protein N7510_007120 [Penicillium lagena]KAJ5610401.1 hypothetical protein N7510_007120 [Penicillium lagena]
MYLSTAFFAAGALLSGLVASDDTPSVQWVDLTRKGTDCWLHLTNYYGCTGSTNDPVGVQDQSSQENGNYFCMSPSSDEAIVTSDICDTANVQVNWNTSVVMFSNPVPSQLQIDGWAITDSTDQDI